MRRAVSRTNEGEAQNGGLLLSLAVLLGSVKPSTMLRIHQDRKVGTMVLWTEGAVAVGCRERMYWVSLSAEQPSIHQAEEDRTFRSKRKNMRPVADHAGQALLSKNNLGQGSLHGVGHVGSGVRIGDWEDVEGVDLGAAGGQFGHRPRRPVV